MPLVYANNATLHIVSKTKHIELDCHFIREKLEFGDITIGFVNSNEQMVDIFTKSSKASMIDYIYSKLTKYYNKEYLDHICIIRNIFIYFLHHIFFI